MNNISVPKINVNQTTEEKSYFKKFNYKFFNRNTCVPNSVIFNKELKDAAYRLLCALNALPETWIIYSHWLCENLNWGKCKLQSAVNELVEKGYLRRKQERINGKYSHYTYDYYFEPIFLNPDVKEDLPPTDFDSQQNSNNFYGTVFSGSGFSGSGGHENSNNFYGTVFSGSGSPVAGKSAPTSTSIDTSNIYNNNIILDNSLYKTIHKKTTEPTPPYISPPPPKENRPIRDFSDSNGGTSAQLVPVGNPSGLESELSLAREAVDSHGGAGFESGTVGSVGFFAKKELSGIAYGFGQPAGSECGANLKLSSGGNPSDLHSGAGLGSGAVGSVGFSGRGKFYAFLEGVNIPVEDKIKFSQQFSEESLKTSVNYCTSTDFKPTKTLSHAIGYFAKHPSQISKTKKQEVKEKQVKQEEVEELVKLRRYASGEIHKMIWEKIRGTSLRWNATAEYLEIYNENFNEKMSYMNAGFKNFLEHILRKFNLQVNPKFMAQVR